MLDTFELNEWQTCFTADLKNRALTSLEAGNILYFPHLEFSLFNGEKQMFSQNILSPKVKNISFDLRRNQLKGSSLADSKLNQLENMMRRYAVTTESFMKKLFDFYQNSLQIARTSYRPAEIEGRVSSKRKDDTRLHVDAFPATPNQGKRILRIFTNINPQHAPRIWRTGENFSKVTDTFMDRLNPYNPFKARLLQLFKITRGYRSWYDHYMLESHDTMKSDDNYQKQTDQIQIAFPAGSTWIVYTDLVSHAAMSGQFVLEQTFYLPVAAMHNSALAPISILQNKVFAAH